MALNILLAFLASFLFGTGAVMQKHGMAAKFPKLSWKQLSSQLPLIAKTLIANKIWVGGFFVGLAGGPFMIKALSGGDITVIQPLINLTIVVVVLEGVVLLKESLSSPEWSGIAILLISAVLISLSGSEPTGKIPSISSLWLFTVCIGALAAICLITPVLFRKTKLEVVFAIAAGCCFGIGNLFLKQATVEVQTKLGAFNFFSLTTWITGLLSWAALTVIIAELIAFVAYQMAFSHGRVSLVTPLTTVISVVVPVIAGAFVYKEEINFWRLSGIVLAIIGTIMLSTHQESKTAKAEIQ